MNTDSSRDGGQATVEFAMALPIVVLLMLGLVQLVVVCRDQLAVELAAREGARAAAVSATPQAAADRAARRAVALEPLAVTAHTTGKVVTVDVSFTNPTDVALIGAVIPDVVVHATVTMAAEPP